MATYFIGDVHGCHKELTLLLDKINYDNKQDRLFLTGDLVGRGPQPLATLELARSLLKDNPANKIVLGNHDLHLISLFCGGYDISRNPDPTLMQVINNDSAADLIDWLIHLPLVHNDAEDKFTLVHAGIPHIWTTEQALANADKVKDKILNTYIRDYPSRGGSNSPDNSHGPTRVSHGFKANDTGKLLASLYGNSPTHINAAQDETEVIRTLLNYFTRMRLCNSEGAMELAYNGPADSIPPQYADQSPWFSHDRQADSNLIVFGHWAAVGGVTNRDDIWALDHGCAWGRQLAAKRLEDAQLFLIDCVSI